MARRIWTQYITTSADAAQHIVEIDTNDNYRMQHLKKVFFGVDTSGVQLSLQVGGREFAVVDATRFAAGNSDLMVEKDIAPGVPLKVGFTDLSSTGLTNAPFMMEYDVDGE